MANACGVDLAVRLTRSAVTLDHESSAAEETAEERLRDKILKALGVTEEDLEAMPMEERMAIEEKIADIIKETLVPKEVTRGAVPNDAGTSFEDLLQAHIGA